MARLAAFVFLPSSEPPPLRTFTLGVLIVTGGTLAALPFRRGQTLPDASSPINRQPTQATGPIESSLNPSAMLASVSADQESIRCDTADQIPGYTDWITGAPPLEQKRATTSTAHRSRLHVQPLTYDDLMAPIDRPAPLQNRYQALAEVRQQVAQQSQSTAMDLPPLDSLAPQLRHELEQRFTAMPAHPPRVSQENHRPQAGGSLASSIMSPSKVSQSMVSRATPSPPDLGLPQLPQAPGSPPDSERRFHWITQPN